MQTDNLRIERVLPLQAPAQLAEAIPLSDQAATHVLAARQTIADLVHGRDPRLMVVVGPCSVHDPVAVVEYAEKLAALAERVRDSVYVVMRVYFEKPRTTVGWKGFINDPGLDESFDVNKGLLEARRLVAQINALGLPAGAEFLDTTYGQYYTDFVSWGAIGARTAESQIHRQLASGLSMPVGIKNGTLGNLSVAVDGIVAASHPHLFPSLDKSGAPALLQTTGNPDCHLVLRGGVEPNYSAAHVKGAMALLEERGVNPRVMVDCSHANSQKDHQRQIEVALSVAAQRSNNSALFGIMVESHLVAGRQDEPHRYGQSITDACLGWQDTENLLLTLAG